MSRLVELEVTKDIACYVDADAGEWFVGAKGLGGVPGEAAASAAEPAAPAPPALRQLWLYTNTDCNLTCRHCLLPEHGTRPPIRALLERVGRALGLGADTVFLTGGEPFLRPDLAELVAFAAPRARIVVLSNGMLIDESRLAELDALGADRWRRSLSFQISVEGPRAVHDALRGHGSFAGTMRGIAALSAWGRPPSIATVVTRRNIDQVPRVTALAGELGLKAHHLFFPHKTGRLGQELAVDSSELLEVVRACRDVARAAGVILDNDAAIAARVRRPKRFVSCHGGHEMVALAADGTVYPCPSLVGQTHAGCSFEGELGESLASPPLSTFRSQGVERRERCERCHLRFFCGGGCAAYSFWRDGRFDAPEPYCEVYRGLIEDHLRLEARRLLAEAGHSIEAGKVLGPSVRTASTGRKRDEAGGRQQEPVAERFSCA
ncbi:MAG: radical SAM protein [Actinobacteria bacterium]|nr:MAG: radical SAM protein [Actinomycetota bacterium]